MSQININSSINSPQLEIFQSTANVSVNSSGGIFGIGKLIHRLKLSEDSRFFIAVTVINENSRSDRIYRAFNLLIGRMVQMKVGDKTILVNINSAAKRLHLSKEEIKEAAEAGKLHETFLTAEKDAMEIIQYYKEVTSQFNSRKDNLENDKVKTGLSRKNIMKVIAFIVKNPQFMEGDSEKIIVLRRDQKNHEFIVQKDSDKLNINLINKLLGAGGFGKANVYIPLGNTEKAVIKQAFGSDQARADVKNEFLLLNEIHKNGKKWGVQAPPKKAVKITQGIEIFKVEKRQVASSFQPNIDGFIGEEYSGNYNKLVKETVKVNTPQFKSRLVDVHQLLYGLKELHEQNIIHGDLKPGNILTRPSPKGDFREVHIADFGGAHKKGKEDAKLLNGIIYTTSYSSFKDIERENEFIDVGNIKGLVEQRKARDVFAMGCILFEAFVGKAPFQIINDPDLFSEDVEPVNKDDGHPDFSRGMASFPKDFPPELASLITDMLKEDSSQRTSIDEAVSRFENYLQTSQGDVAKNIKEYQEAYIK